MKYCRCLKSPSVSWMGCEKTPTSWVIPLPPGWFNMYIYIYQVVVSNMFYVHPEPWGNDPIWRAYFSDGLKPPTSIYTYFLLLIAMTKARHDKWSHFQCSYHSLWCRPRHPWVMVGTVSESGRSTPKTVLDVPNLRRYSSWMSFCTCNRTGCPVGFVRINGLFHLLINVIY